MRKQKYSKSTCKTQAKLLFKTSGFNGLGSWLQGKNGFQWLLAILAIMRCVSMDIFWRVCM